METMQAILARRSVRKYSDEPIPEEKLERILLAGLLAPTSMDKKPCEFYLVQDRDTLKALSKSKKAGAGMLSKCTAAIVVLADSRKADVWVEDCSIALAYMSLSATEEGVANCWCQIRLRSSILGKDAEDNVRETLGISDGAMRTVGILALGMPVGEAEPHTVEDADWGKVHRL